MALYDVYGHEIESDIQPFDSINIEYGRIDGTSYCFCRIPKTTNDGKTLVPKVGMTTADGSLSGTKYSVLDYSVRENTLFCINAGLFQAQSAGLTPIGFTIVDGVSLTNTPATSSSLSDAEEYPLCIYADGHMDTPYWDRSTCDTADMINDGVKYAVTAWGTLVYNYAKTGTDKFNELINANTDIPQQVIGQMQNGDYFVFTSDGPRGTVANEKGLEYGQVADLLVSKGVKFAYSLDGGGSSETVIGKRQLNPIYDNATGRKVPTVIYFDIVDS